MTRKKRNWALKKNNYQMAGVRGLHEILIAILSLGKVKLGALISSLLN